MLCGWTRSSGAGGADAWLVKTDSLGRIVVSEPGKPTGPDTGRSLPTIRPVVDEMTNGAGVIFDAAGRRLQGVTRAGVYYRVGSGRSLGRIVAAR